MDKWSLYSLMQRSRRFEEAVKQLWDEGLISGEMHMGTGEEAVIAGVVSQLLPGDALAVDHRGSAAFLMRGVDPVALLRELLGCDDGLCGGQGGHMHLFSKEHLAASSGIVGAEGPAAVGFALAAQHLRPGAIAVAFFGEGALNQGMLMESIKLASEWQLPVLFVCKDDGWAVTTRSGEGEAAAMEQRVRGLGARFFNVDGLDVTQVWEAAHVAVQWLRSGSGPAFLRARCVHLHAHYLGYALQRARRTPLKNFPPVLRAFLHPRGAPLRERWKGLRFAMDTLQNDARDPRRLPENDPVRRLRASLSSEAARLDELDGYIEAEISAAVAAALGGAA